MSGDPAHESEIRRGTKIGRFVVVAELGAGGMGVVYAAHDRELDRQVALKIMRGTAESDEDRMRMLREGQAMARVTHANVITVFEVGVEGTTVFLAQELLDGGTLGQWLAQPQTQPDIIDKFVAAGRGLAAAHAAGLVHRDFKPDNVLLGKDGRVRVSDFGLARALGPADTALVATVRAGADRAPIDLSTAATVRAGAARAEVDLAHSPMSPLTRTGAVMGTPRFMAPEQHNGERADERSDQFSFCVALYHALYGDWPFPGKTAVALADAVIGGRILPPPRGSHVPARLRRILLRGLCTRPGDRYPSMDALLADLTREPGHPVRRGLIVAGALVLVAGAVVGGLALQARPADPPIARPTPAPVAPDLQTLTTDRSIEWLSAAIERGQLDDAVEKYDMAGKLELQAQRRTQASIAWSAGAFTLALRGRLSEAEARLRDAHANKGQDPIARAYADMAAAAIASARGELATALERSKRCAIAFTSTVPVLAAMCFQLHGDTASDSGEIEVARNDYEGGLAITRKLEGVQRTNTLELALAQLDLDANLIERAAEQATALHASAAERGATSSEAHATVVLARALLAQAESQRALEVLQRIKLDTLQPFRIRIAHQIAFGQAHALLGDTVTGFAHIEEARASAEQQGFRGLVFEARLARVVVLLATASEAAEPEQRALIEDARARGYGRIARLAETIMQR